MASPHPDHLKLREIFVTGIMLGVFLVLSTVTFFWAMHETSFLSNRFGVRSLKDDDGSKMMAALYLQVSIINQALIFIPRPCSWIFIGRPGPLLVTAFALDQLIEGIGWHWVGVIWLYDAVTFLALDHLNFATCYFLGRKAVHHRPEMEGQDSSQEESVAPTLLILTSSILSHILSISNTNS